MVQYNFAAGIALHCQSLVSLSFDVLDDALLNRVMDRQETDWDENDTLLGAAKGGFALITEPIVSSSKGTS